MAAGAGAATLAWQPSALGGLAEHRRGLAGPWRVRGRLTASPEPTGEGALLRVAVTEARVDGRWRRLGGRVEVAVAEGLPAATAVTESATIEAFLALRADEPPANPGIPRRDRLRVRGMDLRSRLKSFRQIRVRVPAGPLGTLRAAIRDAVRGAVDRHVRAAAPARALLLGERLPLSDRLRVILARSGLIHLFAISGLHVGMTAVALAGVTRLFGASPRGAASAAMAGAVAVGALVAPAASVRRATVMASALLVGRILGRRHDTATALAAAALALTWLEPAAVHDPGLQLSAAATAGLVLGLGGRAGTAALPPSRRLLRAATEILRASCAAQLAVAPLLALHGREIASAGLLLNLAAIPLLALALASLSATVLLTFLHPPGADAAGAVASALLDALFGLAGAGARLPTTMLPSMTPSLAALWWLGAAPALRGRAGLRAAGVGAVLLVAAVAARPLPSPGVPRLVALDVGQGDALLFEDGDTALLVDGGGYPGLDYDVGAHVVVPVLRSLGVDSLQAVALSHAHVDHGGGLGAVLEWLGTAELWTGSHPVNASLAARLRQTAGAAIRLAPRGPPRALSGSCLVTSLTPDPVRLLAGARQVDNDASLVLAVACGRRGVLLTGDAGTGAEEDWARELGPLRGGVLKVGHHGSTTSTSEALLDALRPRHAVVSVGRGNVYGLPRDEVLDRLRGRGIAVYRTDRDGAVTVALGGRVRVRGERWVAGRGR